MAQRCLVATGLHLVPWIMVSAVTQLTEATCVPQGSQCRTQKITIGCQIPGQPSN